MSLSEAKKLFDQENYQAAIKIYDELAFSDPALKDSARFLAEICKRRIVATSGATFSSEQKAAIQSVLSRPIKSASERHFPDATDISSLYALVDLDKFRFEDVCAALRCVENSPYQRDLLWILADSLDHRGFYENRSSAQDVELNLDGLLLLAYDYEYWLKNRFLYIQKFESQAFSDARLYDLLHFRPGEKDGSSRLPVFRKIEVPYTWKYAIDSDTPSDPNQTWDVHFGTILLNEKKFIGLNLIQHYSFCKSWTLVEGACLGYPTRKVAPDGTSLDDCGTLIRIFPDPYNKLKYEPYGWTRCGGEDAKSELRNVYLKHCDNKFLVVIDADEFYLLNDLNSALERMESESLNAIVLPQVHFWKDVSQFITGEYYDVSHTRIYRNYPGMKYIRNHNFPEINGKFVDKMKFSKYGRDIKNVGSDTYDFGSARCYHMGFAKDYDDMRDKSDYYINRGEDQTRVTTTESRAAWFGGDLPDKCRVRNWGGDVPDVLNMVSGVKV